MSVASQMMTVNTKFRINRSAEDLCLWSAFVISLVLKEMGLDKEVTPAQASKKWENLKKKYRVNKLLSCILWSMGPWITCVVFFTLVVKLCELFGSSPINNYFRFLFNQNM